VVRQNQEHVAMVSDHVLLAVLTEKSKLPIIAENAEMDIAIVQKKRIVALVAVIALVSQVLVVQRGYVRAVQPDVLIALLLLILLTAIQDVWLTVSCYVILQVYLQQKTPILAFFAVNKVNFWNKMWGII